MKKIVLILSVAALALASCVKTSDVYTGSPDSRQITFAPLAQRMTKSGMVSDNVFPTAYNFYLAAYSVDGSNHDYFDKTEYANEATTTIWSGASTKRYWPLAEETLNFLAVTKQGTTQSVTFGDNTPANYASKVVVELSDNRPNSGVQYDLMYSFARAAVTKNGNGLSYNGGNNVSMAFAHAQSWVNFTVKAGNTATAAANLVVTGIQLKGAAYDGTATITLSNYDSKSVDLSAAVAWDGTAYGNATKHDVNVPGISSVAVNDDTNVIPCGDGLMVVPNPNETNSVLNPSFGSFVVSYTLAGKPYSFEYTPSAAQRALQPGHKYNFDITFTLHEIKVDASVTSWTTGDGIAVGIPSV